MAKYLIEVPHEAKKEACEEAARIFLASGSHFITNADWGCMDGEHKAWILIEVDEKQQARSILPPAFRRESKVIELNKFALDKMDRINAVHTQ